MVEHRQLGFRLLGGAGKHQRDARSRWAGTADQTAAGSKELQPISVKGVMGGGDFQRRLHRLAGQPRPLCQHYGAEFYQHGCRLLVLPDGRGAIYLLGRDL